MKYVPFLKLKQNEIFAIGDLSTNTKEKIIPFFDVEYIQDLTEEVLLENLVKRKAKIVKNLDLFYVDNYDHQRADYINYRDILNSFSDLMIIPVVALDREDDHIDAVKDFMEDLKYPKRLAIRFSSDDIQSFSTIKDDIDDILGEVIELSEILDIVIDLRIIHEDEMTNNVNRVVKFIQDFQKIYDYDNMIITSATDIALAVNTQKQIKRLECELWDKIVAKLDEEEENLVFGDYPIVAPDYVEPTFAVELLPSIMSPKAYYTYQKYYYGVKGILFKNHPDNFGQYYVVAQDIIAQPFFRGSAYSKGDKYIFDRGIIPRHRKTTSGNPSSWIRSTVNSHITFLANQF